MSVVAVLATRPPRESLVAFIFMGDAAAERERQRGARIGTKVLLSAAMALIVAMWVYAFGFAPRESINRIGDREWSARAESRCATTKEQRFTLQDLSPMDPDDIEALRKKADIVEKATNDLERLIDEIEADRPADDKGRAIVPDWIADYRTYISDRRVFVDRLRSQPRRPDFNETEIEGVPVSERINKFARENDMKSCQTPYDLSV